MPEQYTVYIEDKDETQRQIKRLELEHDVIMNASRAELHQAVFNVAFANVDELKQEIHLLQNDDNDDDA